MWAVQHHCRCCGELVCDKCSQHKVQLPRQHETLKGEQRICEHCNTHISYGNFRCIVRYLTVLQVRVSPSHSTFPRLIPSTYFITAYSFIL